MNDEAEQTKADEAFEALSARIKEHLAKFEGEAAVEASDLRDALTDILRWIVEVDETDIEIDYSED